MQVVHEYLHILGYLNCLLGIAIWEISPSLYPDIILIKSY
jgi:hypothetical protein